MSLELDALRQTWTDDVMDDPSITRFLVRRPEQMAAVGALRYRLFIERDGKAYAFADHRRKIFLEPIDRVSLNFCVMEGDVCLAGVRLTRALDALSDPQLNSVLHHAGITGAALQTTAVSSRMVMSENGRARIMIPRLFREIYRTGIRAGMTVCLVCSRPGGVGLFERFGFVRVGAFSDPVAGALIVLRLDGTDGHHLRSTASPLLSIYNKIFEQRAEPEVEVIQ